MLRSVAPVLAALNFEDMLAAAFGSDSTPSITWYPQVSPCIRTRGLTTTPKRATPTAQKMAQEAGYKGEPIRILTSRQFDFHYKMAQVAAEYLRAAGLAQISLWSTGRRYLTRRNDASLYEIFHHSRADPPNQHSSAS